MKVALASSFAGVAFSASHQDVTVGFSGCGGSDNARVYYGSEKGPAISFAHGFTAYGKKAYSSYDTLLSQLADAGYVVIVPESANFPLECAGLWKDQVKALNWLKSSSLASKVDYTKKTGVLGHSMGGGATYHTASQTDSIQAENIGAAVPMNPQIQLANLQPIANSEIPIMFTTGSADTTIVPSGVKEAYTKTTSKVSKVFAEINGGTHTEPCEGNPERLNEYVIAFFDCHLKGKSSQCQKVYKDSSSSALCGGKVKMTECTHANEPSYEDSVDAEAGCSGTDDFPEVPACYGSNVMGQEDVVMQIESFDSGAGRLSMSGTGATELSCETAFTKDGSNKIAFDNCDVSSYATVKGAQYCSATDELKATFNPLGVPIPVSVKFPKITCPSGVSV